MGRQVHLAGVAAGACTHGAGSDLRDRELPRRLRCILADHDNIAVNYKLRLAALATSMVSSMGSVGSLVVLLATVPWTASRPGHAPGRRGRRPLDAVEQNRTSKRRNASAANATREKFVFFVNM